METHLAGGPDPTAHKQYDQHPGEGGEGVRGVG